MSRVIQTLALIGAVGAAACGATTRDTTTVAVPTTDEVSTAAPAAPTQVATADPGVVPVGQELDVRLQSTLSSETAVAEQRFEATTVVDVMQNGRVLIPAGSVVRGVVSSVDDADRVDRQGRLTLSFDQITVRGRQYDMRALATEVFESEGIRDEVGTAGAGAGVGGVIGGLLGGVKGAIIGAAVGAGGAIAATDGKDVTLPAGSVIRIRMDSALRLG